MDLFASLLMLALNTDVMKMLTVSLTPRSLLRPIITVNVKLDSKVTDSSVRNSSILARAFRAKTERQPM